MTESNDWHPLYPFQSHEMILDGHRYHYIDEGAGPVLLMVHGNPTWSFYWRTRGVSGTSTSGGIRIRPRRVSRATTSGMSRILVMSTCDVPNPLQSGGPAQNDGRDKIEAVVEYAVAEIEIEGRHREQSTRNRKRRRRKCPTPQFAA